MIKTPTTFVIGAGASVPSGLPTGGELLRFAQAAVHERREVLDLVLHREGVPHDSVLRVIDELKTFNGESIDDYLLSRPDRSDTQRITRALMAGYLGAAISRRSREANGAPAVADWLQLIAKKMLADTIDPEHFIAENAVTFITFNFDSLVEDGLKATLPARFPPPFDETELLGSVPVIHVHGRLPKPPSRPLESPTFFWDQEWVDWLGPAAESLKVIVDPIDQAVMATAREAVASARILCFLGFGFHDTSVRRLGLPHKNRQQRIVASAFAEPGGRREMFLERAHVRYTKQNTTIGSATQTCYDVLSDFGVFVD